MYLKKENNMEDLEQPQDLGSKNYGKFKDAESLLKAYTSLEAEFTKKSQRLASLENEKNNEVERDKKVEDFITKFDIARPFSGALKETLASDENVDLKEETIRLISKSYKSAVEYANDSEFLNNYIYNNQDIKDKIVKDYLSKVTQSSPIKVENGGSAISLTPPHKPATIQEAGRLAKSIIKQK